MKKSLLIGTVAVVLLAGAGGGWYVLGHRGNPLDAGEELLRHGDLRGAAIQLRNAVREEPQNARAHAALAQVQLLLGDPVAAEKEIKTAAELGLDRSKVLPVLAQSYVAERKWDEVLNEIPGQGSDAEQSGTLLMMRSIAQRETNDSRAARTTIAEAERLAPKDPEIRVAAARLAQADGDTPLALQKVEEALAIDPKRGDALELKAQLVAASGNTAAALALMDQAVADAPDNVRFRLNRASFAMGLGQDGKAREDVDAVLAKQPANAGALYLSMVLLVRAGEYQGADQILQKLDRVIAQLPRGLYFQALIKAQLHQGEQALDAARRYVARAPRDPDGVRLLARIELEGRRPQLAVDALTRAISAGQSDADTLDLLGRAYVMQGRRDEAEQAFRQASAANQNSPGALTRLASSRLQLGDFSGAASDLERTLQLAPDQPGAGETLVLTSLRLGDPERAQAALDKLRQQVGDTEPVSNLAGLVKLAQLDSEGALAQFNATAQKFPESVAARLNEARLLIQLGRGPQAIPVLQGVLAKAPANSDALQLLIPLLLADKRNQEAINAVEAARAIAPDNIGIASGTAELYARLGNLPKAISTIETTKVNGTVPSQLLPQLGRLQLAAGQTDAAKATFAALVAAEPSNVAARRTAIEALVQLKDYDTARDIATEGLRRVPGNPLLLGGLVGIEQQQNGLDAAVALAEKLRADPANMPAAATLKGDVYLTARRFSDAAAAYQAEYNLENSVQLLFRLNNALRSAGDDAKANALLLSWESAHPSDPDVAQLLASQALVAHRTADAERYLDIVLKERPNDPIALNNLAWVYQNKGDPRARSLALRAYNQAPLPNTADTLGWILVSEGESGKALPLLQKAVAARPNDPNLKYHLATALKNLNRRDDAIALLRPIVDDNTEFDEKPAARQLLAQLTAPQR